MADIRNLSHLGVVDTIFEEECEFSSSSSSSSSPSLLPTPLHSKVDAWSLATGRETDISIRVQGTCFRLHKDRLTSRSSYLKRHLTEVSDFTLSPPLNITAETFSSIADFCYSCNVQLTPSNVAALRTATELLGMTESKCVELELEQENLGYVTEAYFRGVIAVSQEYASTVLRSCLPLLPEAETTAFLVSRCIEAMILAEDGRINDVTCLEDVVAMHPQDFLLVADSMNRRFRNHDVLYKIVDHYLKENNFGKLTEEERTHICSSIDCKKLSPQTVVDCVQNPRMPLRFIIKAMLVEQLNTRNSIVSAATVSQIHRTSQRHRSEERYSSSTATTLGEFLHRDAALRESAKLRAAMDSTSSRIQSLEKELRGMKKLLLESTTDQLHERPIGKALDSERPASFHYAPPPLENGNKIERGQRGSVSSSSFRFEKENGEVLRRAWFSGESCEEDDDDNNFNGTPKVAKSFRQRLFKGLKSAFGVSNSGVHRE